MIMQKRVIVMKEKFDQIKYINDFNKNNYTSISCRVKQNEKLKLNNIMKQHNIKSYKEFILKAIELFEKEDTTKNK